MYSVVLMAAITAGSASQECCFFGPWGGHGGYATSCYGAYGGGCFGCAGGYGGYGAWGGGWGGCHGCYGGCFGGCYGGCYGGCHGCYGGSSYGVIRTMPPATTQPEQKKVEQVPAPAVKKDGGDQARAKVVIDVPVNAALYIDNQLMPEKAGKRTFVTPALQPAQTYFYDVKLVVNNGDQRQIQTSRVLLRPGQEVAATFTNTTNSGVAVADENRR